MTAEFPSANAPTTFVLRRISFISRSPGDCLSGFLPGAEMNIRTPFRPRSFMCLMTLCQFSLPSLAPSTTPGISVKPYKLMPIARRMSIFHTSPPQVIHDLSFIDWIIFPLFSFCSAESILPVLFLLKFFAEPILRSGGEPTRFYFIICERFGTLP